jgi:hypothetical protein
MDHIHQYISLSAQLRDINLRLDVANEISRNLGSWEQHPLLLALQAKKLCPLPKSSSLYGLLSCFRCRKGTRVPPQDP